MFCDNTDFECRTTLDRHKELRFVCDCKACLVGTPFHRLSDLRRVLIRGLQYLTRGVDLDGQKHTSISPIIVDSELKKKAESLDIPLASRLIYILMTVVLLEQEGLLDEFMTEKFSPSVPILVDCFRTESNAKVAQLIMKQDNWLGKLCVALKLYGKRDTADDTVGLLLRAQQGLNIKS
jgi:hypothetical protein